MMFRALSFHVWSPAGLPATLKAVPGRSGCTISAAIFAATALRSGSLAGNDVAGIRVAHRHAVDQARRRRIEDLAGENRPAERIDADLVAAAAR